MGPGRKCLEIRRKLIVNLSQGNCDWRLSDTRKITFLIHKYTFENNINLKQKTFENINVDIHVQT